MEGMGAIIAVLWGLAVVSSIAKAVASAKKGSSNASGRTAQRTYTPNTSRTPARRFSPPAGRETVGSIRENGLLLEDRKNDWLAKQMREEAEIYRRGSLYDLGAAHEADCDARRIRLFHLRTHNTNGVDKKTFE
ncbi:MAG: hypothetical protein IIZ17_00705 [Eubacteriaceae bacterium]|nr:hypothetical protein [Eubacteriaceae bacterium]